MQAPQDIDPEGLGFNAGSGEEYKIALVDYVSSQEVTRQAQQRLQFLRNYNQARWSNASKQTLRHSFESQCSNQSTASRGSPPGMDGSFASVASSNSWMSGSSL